MNKNREELELLDAVDLGTPHSKPYMTSKFGRLVERASYLDLLLVSLLAILVFATYFAFVPQNHGIPQDGGKVSRFIQGLYFSAVTFASLGDSNLQLQGFGRFVALLAVLSGLVMVALFIGKIASERIQATIFLLHTSDRERRLQSFAEEIALARKQLEEGVAEEDRSKTMSAESDIRHLMESASNYIYFHAYHSNLGSYGNASALYRFLDELRSLVQPIISALTSPVTNLIQFDRLTRLLSRMESTFRMVLVMQSAPKLDLTRTLLVQLGWKEKPPFHLSKGQAKLYYGFTEALNIGRKQLAQQLTVDKVSRVLAACASGPVSAWPKGDHKRVAEELGISNKMATRCITDLIARRRLPK